MSIFCLRREENRRNGALTVSFLSPPLLLFFLSFFLSHFLPPLILFFFSFFLFFCFCLFPIRPLSARCSLFFLSVSHSLFLSFSFAPSPDLRLTRSRSLVKPVFPLDQYNRSHAARIATRKCYVHV